MAVIDLKRSSSGVLIYIDDKLTCAVRGAYDLSFFETTVVVKRHPEDDIYIDYWSVRFINGVDKPSSVDDFFTAIDNLFAIAIATGSENMDLTNYATKTYVDAQIEVLRHIADEFSYEVNYYTDLPNGMMPEGTFAKVKFQTKTFLGKVIYEAGIYEYLSGMWSPVNGMLNVMSRLPSDEEYLMIKKLNSLGLTDSQLAKLPALIDLFSSQIEEV